LTPKAQGRSKGGASEESQEKITTRKKIFIFAVMPDKEDTRRRVDDGVVIHEDVDGLMQMSTDVLNSIATDRVQGRSDV